MFLLAKIENNKSFALAQSKNVCSQFQKKCAVELSISAFFE